MATPFVSEKRVAERCSERSAQMRLAFRPIQTCGRELPVQRLQFVDVDTEVAENVLCFSAESYRAESRAALLLAAVADADLEKRLTFDERCEQRNAKFPGERRERPLLEHRRALITD